MHFTIGYCYRDFGSYVRTRMSSIFTKKQGSSYVCHEINVETVHLVLGLGFVDFYCFVVAPLVCGYCFSCWVRSSLA